MTLLERIREVNAPLPPEESVLLRVAVLIAVLSAAAAVVAQGIASPGLGAAALLGIPAAFWFSWYRRHEDGFRVKVGLAVGVLVVFGRFLSGLGSVQPGSIASLQVPLAQLFLWVQLLHSLDVPARRDLLFSLVSSLVLLSVAAALSVSMALAPWIVVWGVAATVALVVAHRRDLDDLPLLGAGDGGVGRGLRRAVESEHDHPGGRHELVLAGQVAAVLAGVLVVGLAAFSVLPAAGAARAFSFPQHLARILPLPPGGGLANPTLGSDDPALDPGGPGSGGGIDGGAQNDSGKSRGHKSFGYFGFSTSLDTAARGRPDRSVVMRVKADQPAFWRGQTFSEWDGRRWSLGSDTPRVLTSGGAFSIPEGIGDLAAAGSEVVQTYYLERPGPNLVFSVGAARKVYFPQSRLYELPDGSLRAGVGLGRGDSYTVVSNPAPATPALLRGAAAPGDALPGGADAAVDRRAVQRRYARALPASARTRELAATIGAGAPTTYDTVLALEGWIAQHTRYDLDAPALPPDADAVDQFLFVDQRGFCEQIATSLVVMLRSLGIPSRLGVGYASGERNPFTGLYEVRADAAHSWAEVWFPGFGWQVFDPTAKVPLAGVQPELRAGAGLGPYLSRRLGGVAPFIVGVLGVLGVAAVVGSAAIAMAGWWGRRRVRRGAPPPSWAVRSTLALEAIGSRSGRPRRPAETLQDYATALARGPVPDPRLPALAALLSRDAFGNGPVPDADRRRAERVLDEAGQLVDAAPRR